MTANVFAFRFKGFLLLCFSPLGRSGFPREHRRLWPDKSWITFGTSFPTLDLEPKELRFNLASSLRGFQVTSGIAALNTPRMDRRLGSNILCAVGE